MWATFVPFFISALVILAIITLEVTLEIFAPKAAPDFFYLTTTANVMFNVF
jgi:hypothetical protein